MQLSARILTALAVLTVTVAFVAGQASTPDASAASGSIAVLNVGTCVTSDDDVLDEGQCNDHFKTFGYGQEGISAAIQRSEVYATYATDPKTAAEEPRAILKESDLILVSVTDTGRDTRTGVLIGNGETGARTLADILVTDDPATVNVNEQVTVADAIAEDLDIKVGEVPTIESGFEVQVRDGTGGTPDAVSSGPETLIFSRDATFDADDSDTHFKPIADNRGKLVFYGSVDQNGDGDLDDVDIDGDGELNEAGDFDIQFTNIKGYVRLDEDVTTGGVNSAPSLRILSDIPVGVIVDIDLIYYQTSGYEFILGGDACIENVVGNPGAGADGIFGTDDDVAGAGDQKEDQATCTSDELEDADPDEHDAFVLNASSDGNIASYDLFLRETGRFTGEFRGYLRLTDADGNGNENLDDDGNQIDAAEDLKNWGLAVKDGAEIAFDAEGETKIDAAAVLGVGNGPVTITYKDSDGGTPKEFDISIDIEPPVVEITTPANNSRSDDDNPEFTGTINDGSSGLAKDSFALYVDNTDDQSETNRVLKITERDVMSTEGDAGMQIRLQYTGYKVSSTFGEVSAANLYKDLTLEAVTVGTKDLKAIEADSFNDGDSDGTFDNDVRIDFPLPEDQVEYNNRVDFQALVRDLAGNIGFSDSDVTKPLFINDLGTTTEDDKRDLKALDDVLGMFRRHIVYLDGRDPYWIEAKSVTGFYDLDDEDDPIVDRSGVLIVFDGPVDPASIDTQTFAVSLDEDTFEEVVDVAVEDELVFLKLGAELASDAKPTISIAGGQEVLDLAQNVTRAGELDDFPAKDGILPVFTIELSEGSGVGSGAEGSSQLTNSTINIKISSDEAIAGAPSVSVVCSNLKWTDADNKPQGVATYQSGRTGGKPSTAAEPDGTSCGGKLFAFREALALTRPGDTWEYVWRNAGKSDIGMPDTPGTRVPDGGVTAVVWGRDRSTYTALASTDEETITNKNYGSENATFTFDDSFTSPLLPAGGEVQPGNTEVDEPRPFVLLDFAGELTTVRVTDLTVDGDDVLAALEDIGNNRFLYWPATLDYGEHTVKFSARDAADNDDVKNDGFTFKVTARDDYKIDFVAGWNAISFPADPIDTTLEAVFAADAVDRVIGWDATSATGPWSIATKVDGVWMTSEDFAPLTDVYARYGYWVHSTGFVDVSVSLRGPLNRETSEYPNVVDIPTNEGWNFVGVVDQDGDQTEDNFGDALADSDGSAIPAKDYLAGFSKAYTWDEIGNRYAILGGDVSMTIGDGVWVYFPAETNIGP